MNKTDIMKAIKEKNVNKTITWKVIENTKTRVVISNDYDVNDNVKFQITYGKDEDGYEWIRVDDITPYACDNITYYFKDGFFSDFEDVNDGILKGVRAAVNYFYHVY